MPLDLSEYKYVPLRVWVGRIGEKWCRGLNKRIRQWLKVPGSMSNVAQLVQNSKFCSLPTRYEQKSNQTLIKKKKVSITYAYLQFYIVVLPIIIYSFICIYVSLKLLCLLACDVEYVKYP